MALRTVQQSRRLRAREIQTSNMQKSAMVVYVGVLIESRRETDPPIYGESSEIRIERSKMAPRTLLPTWRRVRSLVGKWCPRRGTG